MLKVTIIDNLNSLKTMKKIDNIYDYVFDIY